MVDIKNIQEAIYFTIDKIVRERVANAKYDRTYRGVVISTTSSNCKVQIDGDIFTCNTMQGDEYHKGDVVYVLFPQSNLADKVVLGKVNRGVK